jgi:MFS family permease
LGADGDQGFWLGTALLIAGSLLLLGRTGAPQVDARSASGRGLLDFCQRLPAIAWAVALFAAFEGMVLTLLPIYALQQGFTQQDALLMASVVVIGDAALQLPIGWLADRVSRAWLFAVCGVVLALSSLAIPPLLHGQPMPMLRSCGAWAVCSGRC